MKRMILPVSAAALVGSLAFTPVALADTLDDSLDYLEDVLEQLEQATGLPWWFVAIVAVIVIVLLIMLIGMAGSGSKAKRAAAAGNKQAPSLNQDGAAQTGEEPVLSGPEADKTAADEALPEKPSDSVAELAEEAGPDSGEVAVLLEEGQTGEAAFDPTEAPYLIPDEDEVVFVEEEGPIPTLSDVLKDDDLPEAAPEAQEEAEKAPAVAEVAASEQTQQAPVIPAQPARPTISFVPPKPSYFEEEAKAAEDEFQRALEEFRKFRSDF